MYITCNLTAMRKARGVLTPPRNALHHKRLHTFMPKCAVSLPFLVDRAAPSPEEALGIQPLLETKGDDCCGDEAGASPSPNVSPSLSALLSVLDAKYTLVYSERKANGSERARLESTAADGAGFSRERGDGGVDDGREGGPTAQENSYPTIGAGEALGGIDLVLVGRVGWPGGKGPKGLLEEAVAILRDGCGGNSGAIGRTC